MQASKEIPELSKKEIDESIRLLNSIDFSSISIAELKDILTPLFKGYSIQAPSYDPGVLIYRGRKCPKPVYFDELIYPKAEFVKNYGRANDIGIPMFYGSIGRIAPLGEIKAGVGDKVVMTYWITTEKLILNHVGFSQEVSELLQCKRPLASVYKFVETTNNFNDLNSFVYNYLASNFTIEVNEIENYKYKLSVAIAEKLLGEPFSGIMYPSIASYGNTENIALYPNYVDKHLKLISVEYIQIKAITEDGSYMVDTLDTATDIDEDGKIVWSGRYLTWSSKKSISATVQQGEWLKRDIDGEFIFPTCGGDIIGSYTPLRTQYNKQKENSFIVTKEFNANSSDIIFKFLASLVFDISNNTKYIAYYIPECPNVNVVSNVLISDYKKFEGIDNGNIIEMTNDSTGELEYTSKESVLQKKIAIYSEQEIDIDLMIKLFPDFELIFYFA